jgi:DNA-binding LacI/PurR family transcriptional regulator
MNAKRWRTKDRVTLRDVAAAAGVSPMTVSNLINGRTRAMSGKTRQRIEREINRLGYRPHAMARGLRRAKRLSIGMIIVDDIPTYLADPFITYVVAGLSNYLSERGYGLFVQGLHPGAVNRSPLIRDIWTDGLCVFLSGNDSARRGCLETVLGLGQPVVAFQDTLRFPRADYCLIRQDDRSGGRMLGEEVLSAGAKQLVLLIPRLPWPAIAERIRGVQDAIRHSSGNANLRVVKCQDSEFDQIQRALAEDIEENGLPDAVLAGNDQMGIATMKLMAARGLKAPEHVLITGFNAFEFWQYTDPVLTTVRSPAYEMGARGAQEILGRLKSGSFASPEIMFRVSLQHGGST